MHSTYPSLAQLADQLAETPEYAPLRTFIRGTIRMALGETKKQMQMREMTDRECVTHSLIESWLSKQGYHIAAQMMKSQMAERYVDNSQQFLEKSNENIDFLLEHYLRIRVPKVDRTPKIENNRPFPKVDPIELKREPIKIKALSEKELTKEMKELKKLERNRILLARQAEQYKTNSDDSDDDSSEEEEESDPEKTPRDSDESESPEEEKLTFLDILKSSEDSKKQEFHGNPIPKSWGPSTSELITDDVTTSDHLPPLTINRPSMKSTKSEDIDALFEDDSDENSQEMTKIPMMENGKPVNVVAPITVEVETSSSSEGELLEVIEAIETGESGESVDELEDFDVDLLSSGGSDYSF